MENKVQCKAAIILGILGIIAGLFIPIIGVGLGIAGIIVNVRKKDIFKLSAGVTLSVIGTVTSIASWIFSAMMIYQQMGGMMPQ